MKDIRFLRPVLERLYKTYDFKGRVDSDPIRFPRFFDDPRDSELAGFISSAFAYGSVKAFLPFLDRLIGKMGASPYEYLANAKPKALIKDFEGLSYRFQAGRDIAAFVYIIGEAIRRHGSIYNLFMKYYGPDALNTGSAISGIVKAMLNTNYSSIYLRDVKPKAVTFLLPSPDTGSACKRLNLFLRWMVRDKDIDLGIWKGIPKNKLVIPLDTHIKRVSVCLGLTKRKTADWKMALEITENLKLLDPVDPLKYDFALCHRGISGVCRAQGCAACALKKSSLKAVKA